MAEVYSVTAAAVAATTTAKTCLEINAGSTTAARIVGLAVTFDASTVTTAAKVELIRFTTTGTGTAYTPLKYNGEGQNKASLCTAKTADTAEPTTVTVVETTYVPNTAGYVYQWPLGREFYLPSSTGFGVRVTLASGTANVSINAVFEE